MPQPPNPQDDAPPAFGEPEFEAALERLVMVLWGIAVDLAPRLKLGCEAEELADELALFVARRFREAHAKGRDQEFEKLRSGRNVRGWVGETIANRCLDLTRHEQRLAKRHARFGIENPESETAYPAPDALLDALDLSVAATQALARLTVKQRAVLVRKAVLGQTYEQIDQELAIPVRSAKRYFHEACARLEADLGDFKGFIPVVELDQKYQNPRTENLQ